MVNSLTRFVTAVVLLCHAVKLGLLSLNPTFML
jgi:hypothetical protein